MDEAVTPYKVVLVFNLKPGSADEELRRSARENSFPNRLAREPGCLGLELVKLSADRTMSIQTWRSERDWWTALNTVKQAQESSPEAAADNILESRDFFGGAVVFSQSRREPSHAGGRS
jgi:hypothetical protein